MINKHTSTEGILLGLDEGDTDGSLLGLVDGDWPGVDVGCEMRMMQTRKVNVVCLRDLRG